MNIQDLIERLEEIRHDHGADVEVRGVFQPDYPLLGTIRAVTTIIGGEDGDDAHVEVFIGVGDGREYGDRYHYAGGEVMLGEWEDDE